MNDPGTVIDSSLPDETVEALLMMSPFQWALVAFYGYAEPEPSQ